MGIPSAPTINEPLFELIFEGFKDSSESSRASVCDLIKSECGLQIVEAEMEFDRDPLILRRASRLSELESLKEALSQAGGKVFIVRAAELPTRISRLAAVPTPATDFRPLTMTRTPLRVSFFGGGTDYPEHFEKCGGAVLGSAIDKFSYITASTFASRLFDYKVRVSYREVELVKDVNEIKHRVYRECLKHVGVERDVELHNVADLPSFTGLGSSSAFTVGLLQALHSYRGDVLKGLPLAYEAIHIEREVLKESVGCQDQTFAAVGGFNLIEFKGMDNFKVHPLPVSPSRIAELQSNLIFVFTNVTRRANDVAASKIAKLSQNQATLHEMRKMVDQGWDILTSAGSLTGFGELLNKAWLAKRSLANEVSNSLIDQMYEKAMANGAIGGKLLGAGGGGFLMLFAPPEKQRRLTEAFSDYQIVRVKLNAPGADIIL